MTLRVVELNLGYKNTQDASEEIAKDLDGSLQDIVPGKLGYQSLITVDDEYLEDILSGRTDLESSIAAHRFDDNVRIGLKVRLTKSIKINSPTRGTRRSDNWGTIFDPKKIGSGIEAFGQQIAAVEAYGGDIKSIEVHIIHPPKGKKLVGWKVV